MAIEAEINGVDEIVNKAMQEVELGIIKVLTRLGELCITRIRTRSAEESWIDRTGNLRSSIGYVVAKDGQILTISDFAVVNEGGEGALTGRTLAENLAMNTGTYTLIVVAGQNYAEYVERMDSKDVLASTEIWARGQAETMFEKLKQLYLNEN